MVCGSLRNKSKTYCDKHRDIQAAKCRERYRNKKIKKIMDSIVDVFVKNNQPVPCDDFLIDVAMAGVPDNWKKSK